VNKATKSAKRRSRCSCEMPPNLYVIETFVVTTLKRLIEGADVGLNDILGKSEGAEEGFNDTLGKSEGATEGIIDNDGFPTFFFPSFFPPPFDFDEKTKGWLSEKKFITI
jgi:hypothetical protein